VSASQKQSRVQQKSGQKDAYDLDPTTTSRYDDGANINGGKNPYNIEVEMKAEADSAAKTNPEFEVTKDVGTDKEETEKELKIMKEKEAEKKKKALGGAGEPKELSRAAAGEAKKHAKEQHEDAEDAISGALPDVEDASGELKK